MKYIKSYELFETVNLKPPVMSVGNKRPAVDVKKQENVTKTWGDLKKLVNSLVSKKRIESSKSGLIEVAADQIAGLIPGAGNIKSAYSFFKSIYKATDDKKSNTWLDKLNVDDQYSKIVDDTIENQFLKHLIDIIKSKKDDELLPKNFNINAELSNYLYNKYDKRTLVTKR